MIFIDSGDVPFGEFRLMSLHVVTRHGDRSPIHILDAKNIPTKSFRCFFDSKMKREMPILVEFEEKLKESKSLLKNGSLREYGHFSPYPDSTICPSAMLTPQGSAQQIRNGLFLQGKYRKHGLFAQPNFERNFKVVTTKYSRTFQTAVSFMYGFLPRFELPRLKFEMAADAGMCREGYGLKCSCPAATGTQNTFSCTFEQFWPKQANGKSEFYERVSKKFRFDPKRPDPRPSHVYDFLVTHYCHNQTIVDNCLLNEIFTYIQLHGLWANKNGRYVDQARLKTLPTMVEISRRMSSLSKLPLTDPKNSGPSFVLYSGHDSTVEPFSTALGVGLGHWPKYSSRVVLEQYKEITTEDDYLRILVDGRPATRLAPFCREEDELLKSHSLCPLENFLAFVDDEAKDYRTNCYRNVGRKDGEAFPEEPTEKFHR